MHSERLAAAVTAEGTLDEEKCTVRTRLYQGRNGRYVERFRWLGEGEGGESYIYKPLTNDDTFGREEWAYAELLPRIPVRCPRLLASAGNGVGPGQYWTIYEDLGPLTHSIEPAVLTRAAALIPHWHRLPLELVPADYHGHSPLAEQVLATLRAYGADALAALLDRAEVPAEHVRRFSDLLALHERFPAEQVVSHGDYHPRNVAIVSGEMVVLDWEYAHRGAVFWDLYNMLDITDWKHPRIVLSKSERAAALDAYCRQREAFGWMHQGGLFGDFASDYCWFAAIYSAWILGLIDGDLRAGRFDAAGLTRQRRETAEILSACIAALP